MKIKKSKQRVRMKPKAKKNGTALTTVGQSPPNPSAERVRDIAELKRLTTELALLPTANAAEVVAAYAGGDLDRTTLVQNLRTQCKQASDGDLQRGEAMLVAQAHSLDAIFANLSRRAALNAGEYLPACESYLRLALKAQSQCRATWETLATIKNPPVIFAKQANFANGHQQVNNGAPEALTRAENETRPNELLEHDNGKRLDSCTPRAAIGTNPVLATVGKVNRAKVARR